MKIFLYFKMQLRFFLMLIIFIVVPYVLFLKISPYEVKGLEYFILTFILIAKLSYFKNSEYKKDIEETARKSLQKKLKRSPSKNEVIICLEDYANSRDMMLALTSLSIFVIGLFSKVI